MDHISFAVNEVIQQIDPSLLQLGFINARDKFRLNPGVATVEDGIRREVLHARVLPALNIVGGELVAVPLYQLPFDRVEGNIMLVRIPKNRTNNRSIISVNTIGFMPWGSFTNWYNGAAGSAFTAASGTSTQFSSGSAIAMTVLNSFDVVPWQGTAQAEVVGENVISYPDFISLSTNGFARCYLENPENLSNIPQRSALSIAELLLYATQAYLYRTLRVRIGRGRIEGGFEIGEISNILDDYKDANDKYRDMLKRVSGILKFSDIGTLTQMVKMQISAGQ